MKNKCTVAFLSFVTEGNRHLREALFFDCFRSFEKIKSENADLELNLVSVDNSSISDVREIIKKSDHIDSRYLLDVNMFDTALFFSGLDAASFSNSDYVLFTYDDFFIYNPASLSDTIKFMDLSGADCCRVTEYDVKNTQKFNSEITPKNVNPDAIRHSNTVTGQRIDHTFSCRFGDSEFYLTNWHYTSRPCVWRASKLREIMSGFVDLKILQGFEKVMVRACHDSGTVFATLDKGMMRTYPVQLSARTSPEIVRKIDESDYTISLEDMKETINRCREITKIKASVHCG